MKRAFFGYISALLLFGTNGVVASFTGLGSLETVLLRTMIGSLTLVLLFILSGGRFTFYKKKEQFIFLLVSGIAMGASWMLLYEAYARIGVGIASLLYYCGPVIVMALSPFLFGERLTLAKSVGFAAVLAGVFLVNCDALSGGDAAGVICGLLSAVMYAVMVIFNKKAKDIVGLENSVLQLASSFFTVALFVGVKQGYAIGLTATDLPPVLVLGILNTGIGCFLYFSSIGRLRVQTVAVCGYLEPLSAVFFSMMVLGERLLAQQLAGAALIIFGAVFAETAQSFGIRRR